MFVYDLHIPLITDTFSVPRVIWIWSVSKLFFKELVSLPSLHVNVVCTTPVMSKGLFEVSPHQLFYKQIFNPVHVFVILDSESGVTPYNCYAETSTGDNRYDLLVAG